MRDASLRVAGCRGPRHVDCSGRRLRV